MLREYVQSRVLGALQEAGAFIPLAFMGGTALRFLFGVARYSEDLDFTLEREAETFSFTDILSRVVRALESEGYEVTAKVNERAVVSKAMLGFPGLLADAGLSRHSAQLLRIRFEVDTNPPLGAGLEVSVVGRYGPFRIQHHDLPSLFAGKIAAVLAREYTKGRDLYDLIWYLTRPQPFEPNVALLTNALAQVAPQLVDQVDAGWDSALLARLETLDFEDARRDVEPFLESQRDLDLIDRAALNKLVVSRTRPAAG